MTTPPHDPMPLGASRASTLHIAWAMAYDFLLNGRRFAIAFLLTPLLPLLLYVLMLRIGEVTAQDVRFFFFMGLLVGESFACTFFIGALQCAIRPENLIGGVPPRLFTLPISTSRLVLNLLAQGIAFSILFHCYSALCFRLITGVLPPLVGPSLFLALLYAWTMAVIWALPDFVLLKLLALVGCAAPLGVWVFSVYSPQAVPTGQGLWRHVGFRELFWMPPALAVACGVAIVGVRRDRRGDARGGPYWEALVQALLDRLPRRDRPFASPAAAQFWLEWRQKGRIMPAMTLSLVLAALILLRFWPRDIMTFLVFSSCAGLIIICIPIGFMIGHCNFSPQRTELDPLRATRPLSDRALAFTVLRCGFGAILLSWLIALAGVAVASFLVSSWGRGSLVALDYDAVVRGFGLAPGWGFWAVPLDYLASILVSWTVMSLLSLATMSGRSRLIGFLLTAFVVLGVAYGILQVSLPDHLRNLLTGSILLILGAGSFLWTLFSFYEAGRRRLITPALRRFGIDLCLLALVAVSWFLRKDELIYILLAAGLCCLPLLPLALAPLALSWNRHR